MYRKALQTTVAAGVVFAFTVPFAVPASAGGNFLSSGDRVRIAISSQLHRVAGAAGAANFARPAQAGDAGREAVEVNLAGAVFATPTGRDERQTDASPASPSPLFLPGFGDGGERVWSDAPLFGGFSLSVGRNQGQGADIAARYSGSFAGTRVTASLGYLNSPTVRGPGGLSATEVDGSASILHPSGLNATIAAGARNLEGTSATSRNTPTTLYAKLGYDAKIFDAGTTKFFLDYHSAEDVAASSEDTKTWGFGVVQKLRDYATELFMAFSVADFKDAKKTRDESLTTGVLGARMKF